MAPFSTTAPPAPLSLPTVDFVPWKIAGARRAPFAFMASKSGDLYALDVTVHSAPIPLGCHPEPLPWLLECTDDGDVVLVASNTSVSCWDRAHARCLWFRDSCDLLRVMFVPGTHRLFAMATTGQIVELDTNSGVTLRELPSHCDHAAFFDISPIGDCTVTVDATGICVVSELASSKPLGSRRFFFPPVRPQFTADGSILVAVDQRPSRVALVSADNGNSLGELTGARAEIIGLAISPHGAIYAWDITGTVSVWDLASHALLFQFHPRQFM